jgi:hypothetical protein
MSLRSIKKSFYAQPGWERQARFSQCSQRRLLNRGFNRPWRRRDRNTSRQNQFSKPCKSPKWGAMERIILRVEGSKLKKVSYCRFGQSHAFGSIRIALDQFQNEDSTHSRESNLDVCTKKAWKIVQGRCRECWDVRD